MGFQMSEFEFQTFFLGGGGYPPPPPPPFLENVQKFSRFLIMRPTLIIIS